MPAGRHYNPPMSSLTLALPTVRPNASTEFDYVLSTDGRTVSTHGSAPLALLPKADALVLVVPSRMLSWHPVRLPPLAANRLRAALDGMLEEHLLDDPAQLAYALVPERLTSGDTLVAVFDKAWMRAVLELFDQANRPATRVVAQMCPAMSEDADLLVHVVGTVHDAALLLCESGGVRCLPLASAQVVLAGRMAGSEKVIARAEPAVAELAEQVLGRAVAVQTKAQSLIEAAQIPWDLTQFELSLSGHGRMTRRWRQRAQTLWHAPQLRAARWGLAGLLLVNLIGLNAWAWKLDAAAQDKQGQIRAMFVNAFPKVQTVVDAPLQMQRELLRLRQARGGLAGDDMEAILSALGSALPDASHASALEFAPGQLTARGIDLSDTAFEALRVKLAALGYTAQRETDRLLVRMDKRS